MILILTSHDMKTSSYLTPVSQLGVSDFHLSEMKADTFDIVIYRSERGSHFCIKNRFGKTGVIQDNLDSFLLNLIPNMKPNEN